MGFFQDLFGGKKETTKLEPMMEKWQLALGKQLGGLGKDWLSKLSSSGFIPGQEYGGQYTAPMGSQEMSTMDMLTKFLGGSPTGDLFNQAKGQIGDTLSGKYMDPNTNPYIKAMSKLAGTNLEDQINASKAARGGRESYFHTQGIAEEGKLRGNTMDNLNALIGQVLESERSRQYGAAPIAAEMDRYQNVTAPLQQISAGQQYGALPRMLAQNDLEGKYNEWKRARGEATIPLNLAQNLFGTQVPYGIKEFETQGQSPFSQIAGIAMKLLPLLAGPAGAAAGGVTSGVSGLATPGWSSIANVNPGLRSFLQ
jgi:hypothetical protein